MDGAVQRRILEPFLTTKAEGKGLGLATQLMLERYGYVVLPEMNGDEVADRLHALRDGVRVLFKSGYTDESIRRLRNVAASDAYLQKPFSPSALAAAVRRVLDREAKS